MYQVHDFVKNPLSIITKLLL